jgi:hypothetical protein
MNMVPARVVQFAASHDDVAGQVGQAAAGVGGAHREVQAAYGPVAAALTEAVAAFESAVRSCGEGLAGDYRQMARAVHGGAEMVVSTDAASAGRFTPPAGR